MHRQQFEEYKRSGTANNMFVGVLSVMGLICGGKSFTGTQIPLVEYCFQPQTLKNWENINKYCTTAKRYVMPEAEFNAESFSPSNPEFQRDGNFLPAKAARLRTIPPSNPDKPWWGLAASMLMGSAYVLSKAREQRLVQMMPEYREQVRTSWLINKLREGLKLHKQAYSAQLDYEFHCWQEDRRARGAQLAAMSPQELAIYQQQVRLQAETQARVQMQQATGQPAALPGKSLDDVTKPGDKLKADERSQPAIEEKKTDSVQFFNPWDYSNPTQYPAQLRWLREFISNTALVLGSQGSGKSWFVRLLALLKKLKGYRVIVFDPNSNRGEWMGVEFYGNYTDIQKMMQWYVDEIQRRYEEFRNTTVSEEQWREKLWRDGKAIAVICEEYSTYADFIEDKALMKTFVKSGNTLSRKQEAPVTFVTHNLTKECLGNIEGTFDIFKRMQRITLDTTTDSVTDQPISAGTATIKAVDSDDLRQVATPKLERKITDFRTEAQKLKDTRQQLQRYEQMEQVNQLKPQCLTPNAQSLLQYLQRTGRTKAVLAEVQPNFKVKGNRFSSEELKRLFNELVEANLSVWLDATTIKISSNQTENHNGQNRQN
jgi:hypothetical protein